MCSFLVVFWLEDIGNIMLWVGIIIIIPVLQMGKLWLRDIQ